MRVAILCSISSRLYSDSLELLYFEFFKMKQTEFIKIIQEKTNLPEKDATAVWTAICEKMADSIANGHGFALSGVGRIYIRTTRVGDEFISFVNYSPDKNTLARLNKVAP